jgi:hypothetical protein
MMSGQVQKQAPTDRISCQSPKWESCDAAVGVLQYPSIPAPPPATY